MRTEIYKLLEMKQFFTLLKAKDNKNCIKLNLQEPSQLLIKNIHANWLLYNYAKSDKHHTPVFINNSHLKLQKFPSVYGFIKQELQMYDKNTALELQLDLSPLKKSLLEFNLIVPQQDIMQYFNQWQRYRKYWWSSVSVILYSEK